MAGSLVERVRSWCDALAIVPSLRPSSGQLNRLDQLAATCRPGADPARISSWERRFGWPLPASLKVWLRLSDGFYAGAGPLIHPLSAIGPMVPFTPVPGQTVPPESWFELGNPDWEPVCIDLGYRWPGGDYPLFTAFDGGRAGRPQVIADGFAPWFLNVLRRGGTEYWLDPSFNPLGDPWREHCRLAPLPPLAEALRPFLTRTRDLLLRGSDDAAITEALGLSALEVEALIRHAQQIPGDPVAVGGRTLRDWT